MKFLIKATENAPEYNGNGIVWGTGEAPFTNYTESMNGSMVGNTVKYKTGLKDIDIDSNRQLLQEEKEIYKEKLSTELPRLFKFFPQIRIKGGGEEPDTINDTDATFWNTDRTSVRITNSTFSSVFDTDNPEDALFYFSVIGGAFGGISPTLEIAERNGNKYYLTGEDDFTEQVYEEEYGVKRKAIGALSELLESTGIDALLYITYLTGVDGTKGFTKNTSKGVFEKALMEFIEGKNSKTGKKAAAKTFYDNYKLWKADKETFIGRAILSAANHYQIIFFKDGKFITSANNTVLASRIEDSYKMLMKPDNQDEFEQIKDLVEEKLNK